MPTYNKISKIINCILPVCNCCKNFVEDIITCLVDVISVSQTSFTLVMYLVKQGYIFFLVYRISTFYPVRYQPRYNFIWKTQTRHKFKEHDRHAWAIKIQSMRTHMRAKKYLHEHPTNILNETTSICMRNIIVDYSVSPPTPERNPHQSNSISTFMKQHHDHQRHFEVKQRHQQLHIHPEIDFYSSPQIANRTCLRSYTTSIILTKEIENGSWRIPLQEH